MVQKEINEILTMHKKWLFNEEGGKYANLRNADLRGADLRNANLRGANLCGANLRNADLRGADLCGANLCNANLCGANLRNANLRNADLRNANLCGANLRNANLRNADLRGANLCGADLCGANLRGADLRGANLCGANVCNAKNMPYIPMICPEEGEFYGYKKVDKYIIKLFIPADAQRSSATTRKCRCSYAKVVGIFNMDNTKADITEIYNYKFSGLMYRLNDFVYPDKFDDNRWIECSNGIHFFINRQEAIDYNI